MKSLKRIFSIDILNKYVQKGLFILLGVCIVCVVASQLRLNSDTIKAVFTNADLTSGVPLEDSSSNIITKGVVTMIMTGGVPSDKVEILVNGEKVQVFNSIKKQVEVYSQCVIEIRSLENKPVKVKIESLSDNLTNMMGLSEITVQKNIVVLNRINFK